MKGETIEQCPLCSTERVAGKTYCPNSKCGYEFDDTTEQKVWNVLEPKDTASQTDEEWLKEHKESTGKLIFPDKTPVPIDNSQRLVGRADLKNHTKKDPVLISRSHFTIYKKNEEYFIKDGITNVQDRPSKRNTFVNDEKLDPKDEHKLENNDKIRVSDIEMVFEA